jgi:uncharacterized membrane protein YqjE
VYAAKVTTERILHKASTPEKTPSSFKLLISGYRDYVGAVKNLILAECRLFATSVAQLLCLAVLAAMVAASLWMVVCAIIYLTLLNAGASIIEALAALLILHIALLVAIGWAIHHSIAGLELQHLRQQLTADKSR